MKGLLEFELVAASALAPFFNHGVINRIVEVLAALRTPATGSQKADVKCRKHRYEV